jgi:hypothetical protein
MYFRLAIFQEKLNMLSYKYIKSKRVIMIHIPTRIQLADIFTKEYANHAVNASYLDSLSEEFIQPDVYWYGFLEYRQHSSLLLSVEKYFTHGIHSLRHGTSYRLQPPL